MKTKRILAIILCLVMMLGVLAGCKRTDPPVETGETTGEEGQTSTPKSYTLNDVLPASPLDWNPHSWETNADSYLSSYCEMGLVDTTIAADGVNFEWVYEMATAIEDITATYADKTKWEITQTEGRVFKITLNPLAKWEDGTVINADTYIDSMKALLDPQMQNYRANTYYDGAIQIYNAANYFSSETPIYLTVVPAYGENDTPDYSFDITANDVYINLDATNMTIAGYTITSIKDDYGYIRNTDTVKGADIYANLATQANAFGYIKVTAENEADVKAMLGQYLEAFGIALDNDLYKEFLFYNTGTRADKFDWANVGLIKSGEYELTYITQNEVQMFDFLTNCTSNWIVHLDTYNNNKDTTGELVSTKYGTSVETYKSYGPYKLVTFEKDKQFVMEKNEAWYGWTDGKHENQYQTTAIKCDIVSDHATQVMLFNQGKLDGVELTSDDMSTYKMSEYLLKTDQTYTFRYIFATDLDKLIALEGSNQGINKRILSYDDFRKAISLSIDRTAFCRQATSGYKAAYSLYNSLYYYDIGNNPDSIYRNSEPAMKTVLNIYGIEYGAGKTYATIEEAYRAITGYDVEEAKALFQAVYEKAKADGNYTDGQTIEINCMCSAATELTSDDTQQEKLLNEYTAAATKGTGLEGKIKFVFQCGSQSRYDDVAAGNVEMIRGAWGGAAFYPFSSIRCYTEPEYMNGLNKIHESCGWDPTKENLTLTVDCDGNGTKETRTYKLDEWARAINSGLVVYETETDPTTGMTSIKKDAEGKNIVKETILIRDNDEKLVVLAALEEAVLKSYQCIPFAAETNCSLFSKQIKYATLNYNIMYGYGGIRLMTYNYDDAAWDAYVASQGGTVSYE